MTTPNTDLKRHIADALWDAAVGEGVRIIPDTHALAAAVLPIVEAEVRAAKAEAWDEGVDAFDVAHNIDNIEPWGHLRANPYKETPDEQ